MRVRRDSDDVRLSSLEMRSLRRFRGRKPRGGGDNVTNGDIPLRTKHAKIAKDSLLTFRRSA
jgi:hypothetical protein